MADTVGSYAVPTFTTPATGAAVQSGTLRANFNTVGQALTGHDADASLHWQTVATASALPTGTGSGARWVALDTRRLYVDTTNGATPGEVGYLPAAGGTVGPLTVNGLLEPNATNTRDLGASGTTWRNVFVGTSVVVNGAVQQGATFSGVGAATGATVGLLNVAQFGARAFLVHARTAGAGAFVALVTVDATNTAAAALLASTGLGTVTLSIANNGTGSAVLQAQQTSGGTVTFQGAALALG